MSITTAGTHRRGLWVICSPILEGGKGKGGLNCNGYCELVSFLFWGMCVWCHALNNLSAGLSLLSSPLLSSPLHWYNDTNRSDDDDDSEPGCSRQMRRQSAFTLVIERARVNHIRCSRRENFLSSQRQNLTRRVEISADIIY